MQEPIAHTTRCPHCGATLWVRQADAAAYADDARRWWCPVCTRSSTGGELKDAGAGKGA